MVIIINSSQVKLQLRKSILNKRSALEKSFVKRQSRTVAGKLLAEIKKLSPARVLIYLSFENEVATFELARWLLNENIDVLVPRYFEDTSDYKLVRLQNLTKLELGPLGIPQPKSAEVVSPESINVAILPGVAFDKGGVRLGYGMGVFDRLLKKSHAYKIGLAYDFQVVKKLPKRKHDLVLDMIVTEKRVIRMKDEG